MRCLRGCSCRSVSEDMRKSLSTDITCSVTRDLYIALGRAAKDAPGREPLDPQSEAVAVRSWQRGRRRGEAPGEKRGPGESLHPMWRRGPRRCQCLCCVATARPGTEHVSASDGRLECSLSYAVLIDGIFRSVSGSVGQSSVMKKKRAVGRCSTPMFVYVG